MQKSETVNQLATALALAQAEIRNADKDSVNPHFGSSYADLASVWEACRVPLTKNGLSVVQLPSASGQQVTVSTVLLHKSGEWISGELTVTAERNTPQGVGSAITYGRRYALAAIAGVAPDEDDDGEAASGRGDAKRQKKPEPKPQPVPAPEPQKAALTGTQKLMAAYADLKQKLFIATGGNTEYYRVLGAHGYEHANELIKRSEDDRKALGVALKQALADAVTKKPEVA